MNARRFGLMWLLSLAAYSSSQAAMMQSSSSVSLYIGAVILINTLRPSPTTAYTLLPERETPYTLLNKQKKVASKPAEVFYAVVLDKSSKAIVMNKNFDVINSLPASLFKRKPQNAKQKQKGNHEKFTTKKDTYKGYTPTTVQKVAVATNAMKINLNNGLANERNHSKWLRSGITATKSILGKRNGKAGFPIKIPAQDPKSLKNKKRHNKTQSAAETTKRANSAALALLQAAEERLRELGYKTSRSNLRLLGKEKANATVVPSSVEMTNRNKVESMKRKDNEANVEKFKSLIQKLLWLPEDVGHRVIKQQSVKTKVNDLATMQRLSRAKLNIDIQAPVIPDHWKVLKEIKKRLTSQTNTKVSPSGNPFKDTSLKENVSVPQQSWNDLALSNKFRSFANNNGLQFPVESQVAAKSKTFQTTVSTTEEPPEIEGVVTTAVALSRGTGIGEVTTVAQIEPREPGEEMP